MAKKKNDLQDPLGNLLQWAVGNRGSKEGNPYLVPEVKDALQALFPYTQNSGKPKNSYRDAADDYYKAKKD